MLPDERLGMRCAGPRLAKVARILAARQRGAGAGAGAPVGAARRAGTRRWRLRVFFLIAGGLSLRVALLGLAAVAAWAALWPSDETDARCARRVVPASRPPAATGCGAWWSTPCRSPPSCSTSTGYVMHANRMAEDLFGARRRGGHVASMSRDPELLAAVDQALVSGATAAVELHERVPVERRLLATVAPLDPSRSGADGPALLISFRDLSEQDRLARMRADFVANASHELRTPLASLQGLRRDAAGRGQGRRAGARALPQGHGRAGRAHDAAGRRSLVALARGDARAPAARRARRPQRSRGARHPDACSRSRARPGPRSSSAGWRSPPSFAATATRSSRCSRTWCRTPSSTASRADASMWRSCASRPARGRPARFVAVGDGRRARHRAPAPAAPHRALLPRQRGGEPREGRHRARARHRQAHPQPPSRRAQRSPPGSARARRSAVTLPAQD